MEQTNGKIGKISKNIIFCFYLCCVVYNLCGENTELYENCAPIRGSDYTVQYTGTELLTNNIVSERQIEPTAFEQGEMYGLVPGYTDVYSYIKEDPNVQFIITIINGKNQKISYDITPILKSRGWLSAAYECVAFFVNKSGVDMLLECRDGYCCIIRFDFIVDKVGIAYETYLSTILHEMFYQTINENDKINPTESVYNLVMNGVYDIPLEKKFYIEADDSTGFLTVYMPLHIFKDNVLITDYTRLNKPFRIHTQDIIPLPTTDVNTAYHVLPISEDSAFNFICSFQLFIGNIFISAKSALQEKNITYNAENLKSFSNIPWVPSGDYKKEEVIIESPDKPIQALLIGNGFYNNKKPYLFLENNRVKEIEIIYPQSYGIKHRVILPDNALVQYIPLLNVNEKKIRLKILSVYQGSKYNDTCLNCIYAVRKLSSYDEYDTFYEGL